MVRFDIFLTTDGLSKHIYVKYWIINDKISTYISDNNEMNKWHAKWRERDI